MFVLNTQTQFQILTCRVDQPDAGPSTPPPEHWDMVLKQLDINPSQIMEVGACWELNGHTMVGGHRGLLQLLLQLLQPLSR